MLNIDIVNTIKTSVSAYNAAEFYGYAPNRSGFICCPFHSEKTPSCKVRRNDRGFKCFGCGESGSVIDFVEKLFDLNFRDACAKINRDFVLGLAIDRPATAREKRAAIEAERKRRRESEIKQRLEDRYLKLVSIFLCMDYLRTAHAPKNAEDEWSDAFCIGLRGRAQAKFYLEEAEWAMLNQ